MSEAKTTTSHALEREAEAKALEDKKTRKAQTKVKDQWIEILVRTSDEVGKGKVILRRVAFPSGHTYSDYIGRENDPAVYAWMKRKIEEEKLKAYKESRDHGAPYLLAKAPPAPKAKR